MRKPKNKPAAPAPAIEDVEELLDVAGDYTHKIWFARMNGSERVHLAAVEPSKVRSVGIREYVRTRWGGGSFNAKLKHVNGQWGQSRNFPIEGEPITARHDDVGDRDRRGRRRRRDGGMNPLFEKLALIAGTALIHKMTSDPKTDPLMLELFRKSLKGDSIDPIEFQRAISAAEQRGETRGRELGEMRAQLEGSASSSDAGGASDSGVVAAVRESAAAVKEVIDYARSSGRGGEQPPMRIVREPAAAVPPAPAAPASPTSPSPDGSTVQQPAQLDIAPEYLRPIIADAGKLLWAIDAQIPADSIVNTLVNKASDEQLALLFAAHDAGRIEADLLAVIPELGATDARRHGVRELLEELGRAVLEIRAQSTEAEG